MSKGEKKVWWLTAHIDAVDKNSREQPVEKMNTVGQAAMLSHMH
jgi:hypothetical protein